MDIPHWSPAKNDAWINTLIKNKQNVYVASPIIWANVWDSVEKRQTVTAREISMLTNAGYSWDGDYLRPPGS
ncbi:hypothetical protein [Amycolatopsis rhizosphaerae]|uniref:hypothetical protein n=1 Tax=Amycolatopsis rhizosphaerae TaxID=2053003 RepID=UPI001C962B4E|nr:hypothetical protein [Amycolatopsis rhizosphaerae]